MKVKIGDLVEIKTSKGLAYALYTHRHEKPPRYGAMLTVFEGLHASRPPRIECVAESRVQFTTFFPLSAAVQQGIVEVVGNVPVPEHLTTFPVFRNGVVNPRTKRVDDWWLWDGERSWRVGRLLPEQYKLPIEGVWNDTLLIERIEQHWRPENDPVFGKP